MRSYRAEDSVSLTRHLPSDRSKQRHYSALAALLGELFEFSRSNLSLFRDRVHRRSTTKVVVTKKVYSPLRPYSPSVRIESDMGKVARNRRIASVALFASLTVALNLSPIKVPAPYLPFLIYQIWEVPIVAALFLFGPMSGVAISVVNTIVLLAVFPGALPTGPLYNLAAVLSMLIGVYVVCRLNTSVRRGRAHAVLASFSTAVGIVTRVAIMTVMNWALLRYPPPVGFSAPAEALVAMLPLIGIFNATLALYTIPLGHLVARAVVSRTGVAGWGRGYALGK